MDRHRRLMAALAEGEPRRCLQSDYEALRKHYQFLPDLEDESTWHMRMVRAYHERLFKEYVLVKIADGRTGLRWRTAAEVAEGVGQFSCGHCRESACSLHDYELDFGYAEGGVEKRALVKARLCSPCLGLLKGCAAAEEASTAARPVY